ncbi:peptidylprolyl isomerase [SAR202 cluster bacterium AC-409-J13_OGT_754m]|nr:peptidylprolyl isomerase [SAR202 cluster bacterium AC-409-J13_OGT_754m]
MVNLRATLVVIMMMAVSVILASCAGETNSTEGYEIVTKQTNGKTTYESPPAMTIDPSGDYRATFETDKGTMVFELLANEVPKTVNNFVFLANNGFYDGVKFHRIIKDFMIQSGDPKGDGTGGPGYRFDDELVTRDYVSGTLAMANAGPNTNGSQFFIVHGGTAQLPKQYTIFGVLVDGMDVVDEIANVPVTFSSSGEFSKPTNDILINSVKILVKS